VMLDRATPFGPYRVPVTGMAVGADMTAPYTPAKGKGVSQNKEAAMTIEVELTLQEITQAVFEWLCRKGVVQNERYKIDTVTKVDIPGTPSGARGKMLGMTFHFNPPHASSFSSPSPALVEQTRPEAGTPSDGA
jgi:hypothetical protein